MNKHSTVHRADYMRLCQRGDDKHGTYRLIQAIWQPKSFFLPQNITTNVLKFESFQIPQQTVAYTSLPGIGV